MAVAFLRSIPAVPCFRKEATVEPAITCHRRFSPEGTEAANLVRKKFNKVLKRSHSKIFIQELDQGLFVDRPCKDYGNTVLSADRRKAIISINTKISANRSRSEKISIIAITILHEVLLHAIPDLQAASKNLPVNSEFCQHLDIFGGKELEENAYYATFQEVRDEAPEKTKESADEIDFFLTKHFIRDVADHLEDIVQVLGEDHDETENARERLDELCLRNEIDPTYSECFSWQDSLENSMQLSSTRSRSNSLLTSPSPNSSQFSWSPGKLPTGSSSSTHSRSDSYSSNNTRGSQNALGLMNVPKFYNAEITRAEYPLQQQTSPYYAGSASSSFIQITQPSRSPSLVNAVY